MFLWNLSFSMIRPDIGNLIFDSLWLFKSSLNSELTVHAVKPGLEYVDIASTTVWDDAIVYVVLAFIVFFRRLE